MPALSRHILFILMFMCLFHIGFCQDSPNNTFIGIHHDLGVQYKDPKTEKYYGGCQFILSKDCQFHQLYVKDWQFDEQKQEISIEGYLFYVVESNQASDTIPIRNFEVFIGRPKNGKLYKTKSLVNTWTLKQDNHSNGFSIKTKLSKGDRLYINGGSPFFLQEWYIGSLLTK